MGEDHIGVILRLVGHGLHIAEGDAEDDVAAVAHQGVHGGSYLVVLLRHVVHDGQLSLGIQAQLLHGGGDAVVVRIGVARGVVAAVDIDGAHHKVGRIRRAGAAAARGSGAGAAAAAAGGQAQDHAQAQDKCENSLLHVRRFLLFSFGSFHGCFLFIKTALERS